MIDKEKLKSRIEESQLFTNRFGSFSKADYEVLMFTVYLDSLTSPARDFEISRDLGITEQKVRSLRVKSQLQYPREINWVEQMRQALEKLGACHCENYGTLVPVTANWVPVTVKIM